jgi:hypothetical protein
MKAEQRQILDMLAEGKINSEEAERLLNKLSERAGEEEGGSGGKPRYLRVVVDGNEGDKVNVRIPMALIRTGLKLTTMLPPQVNQQLNEHGVDLSALGELESEELIDALEELTVDVDSASGEKVRVFCE